MLENERIERGRLARVLHDEVAPDLSGAGLQLEILRMDLEQKNPNFSASTAEIQDILERVMKRVRELSYELNPDIAKRCGFQPALDLLVTRFRKIFHGSLLLAYDRSILIPAEVQAALSRIAEEAVANAVWHGQCTQIEISVQGADGGVILEVRDDGVRADSDHERLGPRSLGLLIMEYYAGKSGVRLSLEQHAAGGSIVRAIYAPDPKTAH